jgi:antibiotic biosynthesis monooxygenase (ABM) superfamily enzyme
MGDPIHIAITRRVRKECVGEFESALAEFASLSLAVPGSRGVHLLHPAPGSGSTEYGILRSFASTTDRDAFYESSLYREWLKRIGPMVEGEASYRNLGGLEAWFRDPRGPMPPRWKMALLTWIAVWPVSLAVPAALVPLFGSLLHPIILAGVIAAGIVVVLTWMAMPLLVRIAHPWIHPKIASSKNP